MKVSISFVKDKKVEGNGSRMSDTSDFWVLVLNSGFDNKVKN